MTDRGDNKLAIHDQRLPSKDRDESKTECLQEEKEKQYTPILTDEQKVEDDILNDGMTDEIDIGFFCQKPRCEVCLKVLYVEEGDCDHMNVIIPQLYLGAMWNANSMCELTYYGISTIVNVACEVQCMYPYAGFRYLKYEWKDYVDFGLLADLDQIVDSIHCDINNNKNVFVHCAMGVSRSASVIIAYLIKYKNMSYEEATRAVKEKRPCVEPNSGFMLQLKTYSQKYQKKL